eukprot:jgi/Chlat1/131/Chrsp1S00224
MEEAQEVTMSASIRTMPGVGPKTAAILEGAGIYRITQLKKFNAQDRMLQTAIDSMKQTTIRSQADWKRLATRCINIVKRAQGAQPIVPQEFRCPITLDWFEDPVMTMYGHSYSRKAFEKNRALRNLDPNTNYELGNTQPIENVALRKVVEYYREQHERWRTEHPE